MGSPAQELGSGSHKGAVRVDTSKIAAESAKFNRTVCELGSGSPPKRRACEVLNAERECQAREMVSEEELASVQGGDCTEKWEDNESNRTSFVLGAEVYEN